MSPERTPRSILGRLTQVEPGEGAAVFWACAYFFLLFASYYIIRPLRDAMGVSGGEDRLAWLYMGTLLGTLLANPIFSALITRFSRRVFVPVVYHFLTLNLIAFYALLESTEGDRRVNVARVFFVWTSVFNLFAVSVFWGFMADLFRPQEGKRLFGLIAVGGTLGAIAGASITATLAPHIGPSNLVLLAAALLEGAVFAVMRLTRLFGERPALPARAGSGPTPRPARSTDADTPPGHGVLTGMKLVATSPYLLAICLFLFCYTLSSTFLYFQQARIVSAAVKGTAERTAVFAQIDLYVNVLTVLSQLFLSGRVILFMGVGGALAFLPSLTLAGFIFLAASPMLDTLIAFQVLRRATEYAVVRPARETLFTVVSREEKYSSKSFIDTFVYRGGDAIGAWTDRLLAAFGLGTAAVATLFVPIAITWIATGLFLGRRQRRLALESAEAPESPGPATAPA